MNIGAVPKPALFSRCPVLFSRLHKANIAYLASITRRCHYQSSLGPFDPVVQHTSSDPSQSGGTARTLHEDTSDTASSATSHQQLHTIASASVKPTATAVWEDVKQLKYAPVPALFSGCAGLIPFVLPPAYMVMTGTFLSHWAFVQNVYGTCMLSFIGGIRWGYFINPDSPMRGTWGNFLVSGYPFMMAWMASMMPPTSSTLTLMGGFAGAAYVDTILQGYPPWYKGLRFIVSLGALLSLWTVLLCKATLSPPKNAALFVSAGGESPTPADAGGTDDQNENEKTEEISEQKVEVEKQQQS
ncbi:uncharacterized protein LOC143280674 [Babylonia areolata]|uniref:uncharacterized protein LOC143280674 n=1 Tax=Babylonia areolata TaxID=304850 RepID=UPI003FD57ED8